jgi:hypothetical protein
VKTIIRPLDETNGCTQEFDSDHRCHDVTHNGVSVNLMDNPGSWSNISDITERRMQRRMKDEVTDALEGISNSKKPSTSEIRYRHNSKMSKSSSKPTRRRKKRTKISKEDSDALRLFECEECLYKSQTRENVHRHSLFSHGIVTSMSTPL